MIELWRSFSWVIPILTLAASTLVIVIHFWKKQKGGGRWLDILPILFVILSIAAIFLITLSPLVPGTAMKGTTNFEPFSNLKLNLIYRNHLDVPIRNLLANIVLFIPFAFAVGWWMRKHKWIVIKVTFLGALLSFLIELFQYWLPLGRATDVDDWMMNTLGALCGGILFVVLKRMYRIIYLNVIRYKS